MCTIVKRENLNEVIKKSKKNIFIINEGSEDYVNCGYTVVDLEKSIDEEDKKYNLDMDTSLDVDLNYGNFPTGACSDTMIDMSDEETSEGVEREGF